MSSLALQPATVAPVPELLDELRLIVDTLVDTAPAPLRLEVVDTLAAAEPTWRAFEAHAVISPYQRFDWIAQLLAARGPRGRIAIAFIHEGSKVVGLLPLEITSRLGVKAARLIGWDFSNGDWMGIDPAVAHRLDRATLEALLAELSRQTGADYLALHSQPERWQDVPNPLLALPHQPAPDHFYVAPLLVDRLTAKRHRNIERGRRRLEEALGPVRMERATTPDAIDAVHAEFLRQRDIRFREMGVANVFAEDWMQRFFRDAARRGLDQTQPVLVLHALYAGEQMVATSIGSVSGQHYAQYINSTTEGPAAKYSLMGLLMLLLVEDLRADGITSMDMGLGDFDYKLDWTDQQTSYDTVIALTPPGRWAARLLQGLRNAKRTIKRQPRLWRLATAIRSWLNRR